MMMFGAGGLTAVNAYKDDKVQKVGRASYSSPSAPELKNAVSHHAARIRGLDGLSLQPPVTHPTAGHTIQPGDSR